MIAVRRDAAALARTRVARELLDHLSLPGPTPIAKKTHRYPLHPLFTSVIDDIELEKTMCMRMAKPPSPSGTNTIAWHVHGTRAGLRMDGDGFLAAHEAGVQLTWMDVKVGNWVVMARHGKKGFGMGWLWWPERSGRGAQPGRCCNHWQESS